jgi:hypothetical protein
MHNTSVQQDDHFCSTIGARTGDVGVWFEELRDFNHLWIERSRKAAVVLAPLRAA